MDANRADLSTSEQVWTHDAIARALSEVQTLNPSRLRKGRR